MNQLFKIPGNDFNILPKEEEVIWQGKSSQWVNLKSFVPYGILVFLFLYAGSRISSYLYIGALLCILKMGYDWCFIYSARYILTNQRIIRRSGVLDKITFEIELYRVKDVLLLEPLFLRVFSLGNIKLSTSQRSTQNFFIEAVTSSASLREMIRKLVERRRTEKGVGEFDTSGLTGWQ